MKNASRLRGIFLWEAEQLIHFVEDPVQAAELRRLCQGSAFGCKLAAVEAAYGFHRDFARFWTDGFAAYGQLDGALTLAGTPQDPEEAAAFIRMLGAEALLGPQAVLESLGLSPSLTGPVLVKRLAPGAARPQPDIRLPTAYRLLAGAGLAGPWEAFYLDLSHRLRHGAARALVIEAGGRPAGCAVAGAVTEQEAVLSALGVEPEFRRKGLGTALVQGIASMLPGRTLYALRKDGANEGFYAQLGFQEAGRWGQVEM